MNTKQFIVNLCRMAQKSQRQLAKELGVSESLISHIKKGRRKVSDGLLIKLMVKYHYNLDELEEMLR